MYFTYGMHYCANVVTSTDGDGQAVLLRAAVPMRGLDLMRARRLGRPDRILADGPAKLCQAFGLDRRHDGTDLTVDPEITIVDDGTPPPTDPAVTAAHRHPRRDGRAVAVAGPRGDPARGQRRNAAPALAAWLIRRTKSPARSIASAASGRNDQKTWKSWVVTGYSSNSHLDTVVPGVVGEPVRVLAEHVAGAGLDEHRREAAEVGLQRVHHRSSGGTSPR